jgi:UDP-glucose:(heptosyl)LPS alpha-1,3-glucosyltransferase
MAADATRRGSLLKRIQNLANRRGVYASVESKLLEGPTVPLVIALSDYVKQSIVASYPSLRPDRLVTLFNAVNLDRFQISPLHNRDATQALMIAQDFERKGLAEAIEAVARVPSVHLTVVGREKTTSWESLAKQKNLADRVQFAGPSSDVRSFYANADFFVLPTRHDPCSLVVLEALACGLPVISTRFNGACEIMHSGVHGYVLEDPKDVSALADAMQRLSDHKVRADMREACIALRPQLSYETHLDTLLSIYGQAKPH